MKSQTLSGQVDFTDGARESFYSAVDDPYFRDRDAALIYDALVNQLRLVPFGDYLKRYIYGKAGLEGDYREVPLAQYQAIIRDAFRDNGTPPSFTPTTARLAALSKNWLTQQSVKRSVVLLLGFGLAMSAEDVNTFLTKALREQMLNPKDPLEAACGYCYRHGYGYPRFEALWARFQAMAAEEDGGDGRYDALYDERTTGVRGRVLRLETDGDLLAYLARLRRPYQGVRQSVAAREAFDALYASARALAADIINASDADDRALRAQRLRERLSDNDRLFDFEKNARVARASQAPGTVPAEAVTPGDIEKIICSAVPMGSHGNLIPAKASELNGQFGGKRFSRQHMGEVLAGRAGIDRFDLITLNFFLYAGDTARYPHARRRYSAFIESMNRILDDCGMARLYVANPYECFVLMCLLADEPLGTYADVLEISYQAAAKTGITDAPDAGL